MTGPHDSPHPDQHPDTAANQYDSRLKRIVCGAAFALALVAAYLGLTGAYSTLDIFLGLVGSIGTALFVYFGANDIKADNHTISAGGRSTFRSCSKTSINHSPRQP